MELPKSYSSPLQTVPLPLVAANTPSGVEKLTQRSPVGVLMNAAVERNVWVVVSTLPKFGFPLASV
jgi:hypothetical protein